MLCRTFHSVVRFADISIGLMTPNEGVEIDGYQFLSVTFGHIVVVDLHLYSWLKTAQCLRNLPLSVVVDVLTKNSA